MAKLINNRNEVQKLAGALGFRGGHITAEDVQNGNQKKLQSRLCYHRSISIYMPYLNLMPETLHFKKYLLIT